MVDSAKNDKSKVPLPKNNSQMLLSFCQKTQCIEML